MLEERRTQSTAVSLVPSPDGILCWKGELHPFSPTRTAEPGPPRCPRAPACGAGRQPVVHPTVGTFCLRSLGAPSLDFLDKSLVITRQGTSAASLMLILFQILVLLPNARIFSKFTLFIVINHDTKLLQ